MQTICDSHIDCAIGAINTYICRQLHAAMHNSQCSWTLTYMWVRVHTHLHGSAPDRPTADNGDGNLTCHEKLINIAIFWIFDGFKIRLLQLKFIVHRQGYSQQWMYLPLPVKWWNSSPGQLLKKKISGKLLVYCATTSMPMTLKNAQNRTKQFLLVSKWFACGFLIFHKMRRNEQLWQLANSM